MVVAQLLVRGIYKLLSCKLGTRLLGYNNPAQLSSFIHLKKQHHLPSLLKLAMRPTAITYTILAIGNLIMIFAPESPLNNWYTTRLRSTVIYSCMAFSAVDSLCRIILHYRVNPVTTRDDNITVHSSGRGWCDYGCGRESPVTIGNVMRVPDVGRDWQRREVLRQALSRIHLL